MAVEVIEGTLEPTRPTGTKWGYGRYDTLNITVPNGQVRSLRKVAVGRAMVDEIGRGGPGRYYLATVDGALAMIGVRRDDGSATYAHHTNIEPIVLVGGLLGTAAAVARFGFGADVNIIPCIVGPLLLLAWLYMRNQRLTHKGAYDADG